jgi:hypothetical protein
MSAQDTRDSTAGQSQHTPGPWQIFPNPSPLGLIVGRFGEAAQEAVCDVYASADGGIRGNADAALIAAAPDLLEALKGLLADIGGGTKTCGHDFACICAGDKARGAINRAEGRNEY